MSDERRYDVGPGFVRAKECPDCFHTRCGEDCVCNCDAARAEDEAAALRGENERLRKALVWYADPNVWRVPMRAEMANADDEPASDAQADRGERARAALDGATAAHAEGGSR